MAQAGSAGPCLRQHLLSPTVYTSCIVRLLITHLMHLSISIQPMCYTVELHAMLYSEASHSGTLMYGSEGSNSGMLMYGSEGSVRLQKRNQRKSETTRLQSSARAVINRRAPKSYRSARASIFSVCACHTARSSTFSACALRCYTDISIRFTLCNKETKERVY